MVSYTPGFALSEAPVPRWKLERAGGMADIGIAPTVYLGFPGGASGKEPACQCRRHKRLRFDPWVGKIPWSRKWQSIPVFLPGTSHAQRNLVGYSPWGRKELDTTKHTQKKKE